jgi:hypothetical protein
MDADEAFAYAGAGSIRGEARRGTDTADVSDEDAYEYVPERVKREMFRPVQQK